jgi:hypothetical protein
MRSLKNLCYEENMKNELHEKAKAAANEYQNCEVKLIQILKEIDTSKIFLKMGYSSLFIYITEALGLSEAVAYNLSTVVRKSKEVPELQKAIENGLALCLQLRLRHASYLGSNNGFVKGLISSRVQPINFL